jgi:hypothetical protein
MTNETAHPTESRAPEASSLALLAIATGLADGVHTLIPSATAAIVVAIGPEWQLLAQNGPVDITAGWRGAVANQVRDSDLPQQHADYLVAPFSAVGLHALLIVAAESVDHMPRRAHALVQPLLDAGGILLDRAALVQQRERSMRRVVRLCKLKESRPLRTIADLERAVASLWPNATARLLDPNDLGGTAWSARRLVRIACDLDQPSIGRTPAYEGLMPRDLAYQVAIPMPSRDGALLIECLAGGEEFDTRSLATAIALTRDIDEESTEGDRELAQHA